MVAELQSMLDQVTVIEDIQDKVWWSFHSSGCFSVKAFQYQYSQSQWQIHQFDTSVSRVWRGICPPKAELLLWLVLIGRINTKERLTRLNILHNNDIRCVLCKTYDEDINHLFFTCHFAWRVWSCCCQWWEVSWVFADNPSTNFESWCAVRLHGGQKRLWILCFYVVVWSLWDLRNNIIFRDVNVCFNSFMTEVINRCRLWVEFGMK